MLLAAGALVGYGKLELLPVYVLILSAALCSDLFYYHLGKWRGGKILPFLCRLSVSPDFCISRANELFARQGARSLLIAKFLPGVNALTPPLAGIFRMDLRKFLVWDSLGILLWISTFVLIGFQFHHQLESLAVQIAQLGNWLGALLLGALAVFMAWKFHRRRRHLSELALAHITPEEARQKMTGEYPAVLLDVRSTPDVQRNPVGIPGALHLPLETLHRTQHQIPRDREVILFCA
jgi:membrane protein DedA with SNARE-associated domain